MKLGKFTEDKNGVLRGKLQAYGMQETTIILTPRVSSEGNPYYDITGDSGSGLFDGGAAFPKQKGNWSYLSVTMDSPAFPMPINAGLFPDKTNPAVFSLVWDRQQQPRPVLAADEMPNAGQAQRRQFIGAGATP